MTAPAAPHLPGIYDRSGAPITLARYIELHGDEHYRVLASDAVGARRIITAWLGIDHGPLGDGDVLLIFGTVALEPGGQLWQGRELLTGSEIEALHQHETLLRQIVELDG